MEGFEPSLTEPESVVLPLHHISIVVNSRDWDCKSTILRGICKIFLTIFRKYLFSWTASYKYILSASDQLSKAKHRVWQVGRILPTVPREWRVRIVRRPKTRSAGAEVFGSYHGRPLVPAGPVDLGEPVALVRPAW